MNDKYFIFSLGKSNLIVIFVYFNFITDVKSTLQEIGDLVGNLALKFNDLGVVLCGDFNCRIGSSVETNINKFTNLYNFSEDRGSQNAVTNDRGRQLLGFMTQEGYIVLNGRSPRDSPAKFTFVSGVGKSAIDLAWANQSALEIIFDHFHVDLKLSLPQSTLWSKSICNSIRWVESLR